MGALSVIQKEGKYIRFLKIHKDKAKIACQILAK
jgi:hypothetical protein